MVSKLFEVSRRAVVKLGLSLGLGSAGSSMVGAAAATDADYQPKTLTPPELDTLKALMSRLIPSDDATGGAVEACAYVYVDRALGAYHARHVHTYRDGLAELDEWARRDRYARFAEMPTSKMDELITRMEKGELTGGAFSDGGTSFFNLTRRHTLEGFLADPMYGGNKNFLGWETIGFNGVQLYYSAEAQQLNGKDGRPQRSIADFGGSPML